jgi:hypothetical protein
MASRKLPYFLTAPLLALVAVASVGCAPRADLDGQYATAKQGWDSPHPTQLNASLRNRLATTQRDN